jgi:hypothetical protein
METFASGSIVLIIVTYLVLYEVGDWIESVISRGEW